MKARFLRHKKHFFFVVAAFLAVLFFYQALPFVSSIFPLSQSFDPKITRHEFNKPTGREPDTLLRLSSIQKPKIVILWSLGCMPCFQMLAVLNKMSAYFVEKDVEIVPILISPDRNRPSVYWGHVVVYLARAARQGASWQTLFPNLTPYYDADGSVLPALDLKGTPTLLCLNQKGRIISRMEGFQNWQTPEGKENLDALVEKMKIS